MLIRDVRPWGGERSDVQLDGTRIAAIRPHDPAATPAAEVVEGRGRLLLPSFSDVHVHLDSTRVGLPFRPHTGGPGVWTMMMNDRENWRDAEVALPERVAADPGAHDRPRYDAGAHVRAGRRGLQAGEIRGRRRRQGEVRAPRRRPDHDIPAGRHPARARDRRLPGGIAQGGRRRDGRHRPVHPGPRPQGPPRRGLRPCREIRRRGRHPPARARRTGSLLDGPDPGAGARPRYAGQGHHVARLRTRLGERVHQPPPHRGVRGARHRHGDRRPHAAAANSRSSSSPRPVSASASARTASATTGARTATATCSIAPGSSPSPTTSAATTTSRCASRWRAWAAPPS